MNEAAVIKLDQTVAKSDNFVESSIDDETVLMNLDEGSFSSLIDTGMKIWSMMDEPVLVSDICVSLLGEFDVEKTECENQTVAFLQSLKEKGFIEVR